MHGSLGVRQHEDQHAAMLYMGFNCMYYILFVVDLRQCKVKSGKLVVNYQSPFVEHSRLSKTELFSKFVQGTCNHKPPFIVLP